MRSVARARLLARRLCVYAWAVALLVGLAVLVLLCLPLAISLARSNELFVIRVELGNVELVRGRVPPALLQDLEDVFQATSASARIRVVAERGRPRVTVSELDEGLAQRVRNVVGRFPIAQIRAGRRPANRFQRRARARARR